MAFPGNKADRKDELKRLIPRVQWDAIVDPFFGSGGLTRAFLAYHTADQVLAGEAFSPLRSLISTPVNCSELFVRFKQVFDSLGAEATWQLVRQCLFKPDGCFSPSEAFVVLNNLSYGNSMRHGPSGHNVKVDDGKLSRLLKRKAFIDPIIHRPKGAVFGSWEETLEAVEWGKSIAVLLDPPYLEVESIYCTENPSNCALPPIVESMRRGAGVIVGYNSMAMTKLEPEIATMAIYFGYEMQVGTTNWKQQFAVKRTRESKPEYFVVLSRKAGIHSF